MTQAEIMELLNLKRQTLEQRRLNNPTDNGPVVKILENEIKDLELSLVKASSANKKSETKVFLDECAG
jgi:hypothetical protein